MNTKTKTLKFACYSSNITMSIVGNISPVLFLTFRSLYGISYSLLGLLVVINFVSQLTIDLIFSFFSHKFNIQKTVKLIPIIASIGMIIYAFSPFWIPGNVYVGLVIGTIVFSTAGGLGEVLISPVIAAIPSDDPEREMSKLHSIYAWGVVFVIIISTLYLLLVGTKHWQWLVLGLIAIPLISSFLFAKSDIPEIQCPEKTSGALKLLKNRGVWLCFLAIFIGGASECTMAQWSSGYLEQALGIPKIWGDIFGVAMFSVMLGLGRTLYSKIGKNIGKVLTFGAIGATLCYVVAAVSSLPLVGLIACALTGFCVSMLWPGNLIVASSKFPAGGVFIYALMAAGGDLGASVVPQLVGSVADVAISLDSVASFAISLGLTPEQFGLKLGMLIAGLFPLIGIFVYLKLWKGKKKKTDISNN